MNMFLIWPIRFQKINFWLMNRPAGLLKALWLVPFLAVGYIGWMNLAPAGVTVTYFIDANRDNTGSPARITTADRLSQIQQINGITVRNVRKDPVNFELESPSLRNASEVSIEVRFQDQFPDNGKLSLGAQSNTGNYVWTDSYIPFFEQLNVLHRIASSGDLQVYATREGLPVKFKNVDDFLQNAPAGSVVATNEKGLQSYRRSSPENPPVTAEPNTSSSNGTEDEGIIMNTALRGGHIFWTLVNNGKLELTVEKQDLNWYEKADELVINAYSPAGELISRVTIPDDGDQTKGKQKGPIQSAYLTIADAQPGAYRIEMVGGGDVLLGKLQVNQEKLVAEGKLWVVGTNSSYFESRPGPEPVRIYGRNLKPNEIRAFSYHNSGLQSLNISGDDFDQTVVVDKINTEFNASLSTGPYSVTVPKQNILIQSDGYFSFTPGSFFLPQELIVIPLNYNLAWAREHADYVVINANGYMAPQKGDDGWLVGRACWQREDLLVEGNKLRFAIGVPHLKSEPEMMVPVGIIKIQVKTLPLHARLALLNRASGWIPAMLQK